MEKKKKSSFGKLAYFVSFECTSYGIMSFSPKPLLSIEYGVMVEVVVCRYEDLLCSSFVHQPTYAIILYRYEYSNITIVV